MSAILEQRLSYEDVVEAYHNNLEIQTRGFSAGSKWMESWVPDDELLPSLLNLIDAAQLGGIDSLVVTLRLETLGDTPPQSLCTALRHVAQVSVIERDGQVELQASQLQHLAKFTDVRDYYRGALLARHADLRFQSAPPRGAHAFTGSEGTFWLQTDEDGNRVIGAGYAPAPAASAPCVAAMDVLCSLICGLPLIEVREHALVKLEYRLRDSEQPPPVQGILLPQNGDALFLRIGALLQGLLRSMGAWQKSEINFYDTKPSKDWVGLGADGRVAACQKILDAASERLLAYDKGIFVVDSRRSFAVTVRFHGDAPVATKRRAALQIEKLLRFECDPRLEVFCLEMKDRSEKRRLTPETQKTGENT
jgi:hypothetical protein